MIAGYYNYWIIVLVMMIGLYIVMSHGNFVKQLLGLNVFQAAVFMLYISFGKIEGGTAPILEAGLGPYSHPLPHVMILTAIVVGVSMTALGLALIVRIHEAYGTVEEDQALAHDRRQDPDGKSA